MGPLGRFIVEYVGNLEPLHREDSDLPPPFADRRANHHNRQLVNWIKGQMEARCFSAARKDEFINDLRAALRQGETVPAGVSDEETGFSRDAQS